MNQREVWDIIADDWHMKRVNPVPDTTEFIRNKKGLVLDIGCGAGRNLIRTDARIVGVDFSGRQIALARRNAKKERIEADFAVADALGLPFSDNSFDSVVIANVLHCIKRNKSKKALEEIRRVAKNGTQIFVSVWNRDQPRFTGKREAYIPWTVKGKTYQRYYYLYSKDELSSLLRKYFTNVRIFGSKEKAFKKYPKNIIAVAKVRKPKKK